MSPAEDLVAKANGLIADANDLISQAEDLLEIAARGSATFTYDAATMTPNALRQMAGLVRSASSNSRFVPFGGYGPNNLPYDQWIAQGQR